MNRATTAWGSGIAAKAALVAAVWLALVVRAGGARAAEPDAEASANALVTEAARAYDDNRLDEALTLLNRAYALSPRPSIVYNQAQVLRAKQDCAAALDAYDRFIAGTSAADPNRERALGRRAEMKACVDRQPAALGAVAGGDGPREAPTPPAARPTPPGVTLSAVERSPPGKDAVGLAVPVPSAPTPPPPQGRRTATRVTGWALIGVGVVAAGAAALYAWKARDIQEDLNAELRRDPAVWTAAQQGQDDDGRRAATRARWLGAAAALAGAGGGVLLFIGHQPRADGGGPSSVAVGWSGTF